MNMEACSKRHTRGKWRKWASLSALLMLLSAALLSGCQAVGGVDLNKAMLSNLTLNSSEGDGSLALHLDLSPGFKPTCRKQAVMLKLLKDFTIDLRSIKKEDNQTTSLQGSVQVDQEQIPFLLYTHNGKTVLRIQGVDRPILFGFGASAAGSSGNARLAKEQEIYQAFAKIKVKLADTVNGYLLHNLPNPQNISVTDATADIHGDSLRLRKVHAEIHGDDVLGMLQNTMQSMLKDPQGMKQMLGDLYDLAAPILLKDIPDSTPGNPSALSMKQMFADKTLAVEFIYNIIQQYLKTGMQKLDSFSKTTAARTPPLTNDTRLIADLYVDNQGMIRKSDVSLHIALPANAPITGIDASAHSEVWSLNGNVTADSISEGNAMNLNALSNPIAILPHLDKNSAIYRLLVNDLQIAHKELHIKLYREDFAGDNSMYMPFQADGMTMVPVRYVSENLNAKVQWDDGTHTITIIDLVSGKTIVMTQGSNIAMVDGRKVSMDAAVQQRNDLEYVPLRFITMELGGQPSWDSLYMPYELNGAIMVPVRYVSENLNAKVQWDDGTRTITIIDLVSGKTIVMTQGSSIAMVDGRKVSMDVAVQEQHDLEFVPLRFIAEELGGQVSWDSQTQTVTVIRN